MATVITKFKVETDQYDKKIKEAQRALDQFGLKGTEVGGKISNLSQVLTTNIGSLSKWSVALGAGAVAVKVIGDAFKKNEIIMDEWGRVTQSAGAVYDGFLNALNTGDVSGFLSNIDKIVSAARDAYDAIDELGTFNAFNQINKELARTGFTQTIADYRTGKATKQQAQEAGAKYQAELQKQADKERLAYEAAVKQLAASRDVDYEMLLKALSGSYGDYETLKALPLTKVDTKYVRGADGVTRAQFSKPYAANEEEALGEMLRKLTDEELNNLQSLGVQAQRTLTEVASVDRQMARFLGTGKGTATASAKATEEKAEYVAAEGSIDAMEAKISELTKQWKAAATDEARATIKEQIDEATQALDKMVGKEKEAAQIEPLATIEKVIQSGSMDELNEQLQEAYEELDALAVGTEEWYEQLRKVNSLKAKKQKYDEMENPTSEEDPYKNMTINQRVGGVVGGMGAVIGGISTISSSLETLGVDVSDDFKATLEKLGAVINIIQAINGIFTTVVTILSIIMARSLIPGLHAGGIVHAAGGYSVPGALNGGKDTVPAILSPGELVLNRAQQVSLASQLTSGSAIASGRLSTRIKGGDIIVALDNTNRARGGSRGLYAYSK